MYNVCRAAEPEPEPEPEPSEPGNFPGAGAYRPEPEPLKNREAPQPWYKAFIRDPVFIIANTLCLRPGWIRNVQLRKKFQPTT